MKKIYKAAVLGLALVASSVGCNSKLERALSNYQACEERLDSWKGECGWRNGTGGGIVGIVRSRNAGTNYPYRSGQGCQRLISTLSERCQQLGKEYRKILAAEQK